MRVLVILADKGIFIPDTSLFLVELVPPVVVKELSVAYHFLLGGDAVCGLSG